MSAQKFKLLLFGSDSFSVKVLDYLLRRKICPIQVVTGQYSELDQFSRNNSLKRSRWPLKPQDVYSSDINIGLVASFGHLINVDTINLFEYGLFNIHPSLLPQYRGSTPIQAALMDGLSETGCTLIKIPPVAKFDIGDIVLQERVSIRDREFATDLRERLAIVGAVLAEKLLLDYEQCIRNIQPQGGKLRSYAKKLEPEQGLLKFTSEESSRIDRKIRAYTGTIEIYTFCLNGLKVKLEGLNNPLETEGYDVDGLILTLLRQKDVIKDYTADVKPGTMFFHKVRHILCIKCFDDKWIAFDSVTPEHKPKMSALDFYNGYMSKLDLEELKTDI